jgi:hypothetical protein
VSEHPTDAGPAAEKSGKVHELLLRMDLATEVLEGLDELGLETRAQVEELLAQLEREIGDAT